jgi:hypothetical protein
MKLSQAIVTAGALALWTAVALIALLALFSRLPRVWSAAGFLYQVILLVLEAMTLVRLRYAWRRSLTEGEH